MYIRFLLIVGLLGLITPLLKAQPAHMDVTLGVRANDIDGNEGEYLTQHNLDEGLYLESFSYNRMDLGGAYSLMDHFRLDASGFGANPHGFLKLSAGKVDLYELDFTYNRSELFSQLSQFANPLEDRANGSLHTMDGNRQWLDLSLIFRPQARLRPFIKFYWNQHEGPGRTTYRVGSDEFQVNSDLKERETIVQAGASFVSNRIRGEFSQGFRNFQGSNGFQVIDPAGNQSLDDQVLNGLNDRQETEAEAPVTRLNVTADLHDRVALVGSFVYSDNESEYMESEQLNGFLTQLPFVGERRSFPSRNQTVQTETEAPSWNGRARLETRISSSLQLDTIYQRRHREVDGFSFLNTLFIDSLGRGEPEPRDVTEIIEARTVLERDEAVFDNTLTWAASDHLSLWAGYAFHDQAVETDVSLAQIVIPNSGQEGNFNREFDHFKAGMNYRRGSHRASFEYHREDAEGLVFRTDFHQRDRARLRLGVAVNPNLQLHGKLFWTNYENTHPASLDGEDLHAEIGLNLTKEKWLLSTSYGVFERDSSVIIAAPQEFTLQTPSIHKDDGSDFTLIAAVNLTRFSFGADLFLYENTGILEFSQRQMFLKGEYTVNTNTRVSLRAGEREFEDDRFFLNDFSTTTFELLLRYTGL